FTVTFEDRYQSLVTVRQIRIDKYLQNVDHLHREGKSDFVDTIVVGSLGSWDSINDVVLLRMGISYAALMRKLICTNTNHWGRAICIEHVCGKC
ncbi:hypothetical protein NPIL_240071, partial [Nephila pilipes]